MDYSSLIIMAIIQGITESLPISSSAHLMLFPLIMHAHENAVLQDIAVQAGSTLGFILYFRHMIKNMVVDFCRYGFTKQQTLYSRLAWLLVMGTIPVGIAGLLFHQFISDHLHSAWVIAFSAIFFGLLMGLVDKYAQRSRTLEAITFKDACIIGLIQICALIPGASRSGVTMTAGRALGITRQAAAQFSFLLSIPVSLLAVLFQAKDALETGLTFDLLPFALGMTISGVLAYGVITLFIRWIDGIGLMPFAIYRVILGLTVIVLIMNGVIL